MKKRACISLLLMIFLVSLGAITSAFGQSGPTLRAHIPFDFYASGQTMPAGDYIVEQVFSDGSALRIRSADGRERATILTNSARSKGRRPGAARLVFNRYDDQRFLSAVWQPGGTGRALRTSMRARSLRQEMRIAKGDGDAAAGMEVVVVVAGLEQN